MTVYHVIFVMTVDGAEFVLNCWFCSENSQFIFILSHGTYAAVVSHSCLSVFTGIVNQQFIAYQCYLLIGSHQSIGKVSLQKLSRNVRRLNIRLMNGLKYVSFWKSAFHLFSTRTTWSWNIIPFFTSNANTKRTFFVVVVKYKFHIIYFVSGILFASDRHSDLVNICRQLVIIIVTTETFWCLHRFQILNNWDGLKCD